MGYFTKQTISISSETTTWSGGKVAHKGAPINGTLYAVRVSAAGGSTNKYWAIHAGATDLSRRAIQATPSKTTALMLFPKHPAVDAQTTTYVPLTTALFVSYPFVDEKPWIVMSGTQKSFTLTLYIDGVTPSGGSTSA